MIKTDNSKYLQVNSSKMRSPEKVMRLSRMGLIMGKESKIVKVDPNKDDLLKLSFRLFFLSNSSF